MAVLQPKQNQKAAAAALGARSLLSLRQGPSPAHYSPIMSQVELIAGGRTESSNRSRRRRNGCMAVIGREQRQIDAIAHISRAAVADKSSSHHKVRALAAMLLGKFCTIPAAAPSDCVF
jgi:hypothetical protein